MISSVFPMPIKEKLPFVHSLTYLKLSTLQFSAKISTILNAWELRKKIVDLHNFFFAKSEKYQFMCSSGKSNHTLHVDLPI